MNNKPRTEEHKAKIAEAMRLKWEDKEYRERNIAGVNARWGNTKSETEEPELPEFSDYEDIPAPRYPRCYNPSNKKDYNTILLERWKAIAKENSPRAQNYKDLIKSREMKAKFGWK